MLPPSTRVTTLSSLVPTAPAGGRQGTLTTEPPCVVPGFEASRDAGRAEGTPGALLIGGDCLPVYLPVASVRASTRGLQGPGLGQDRGGLAACPTGPFSSYWPAQGVRELGRQGDVLGKERWPPNEYQCSILPPGKAEWCCHGAVSEKPHSAGLESRGLPTAAPSSFPLPVRGQTQGQRPSSGWLSVLPPVDGRVAAGVAAYPGE